MSIVRGCFSGAQDTDALTDVYYGNVLDGLTDK